MNWIEHRDKSGRVTTLSAPKHALKLQVVYDADGLRLGYVGIHKCFGRGTLIEKRFGVWETFADADAEADRHMEEHNLVPLDRPVAARGPVRIIESDGTVWEWVRGRDGVKRLQRQQGEAPGGTEEAGR